MPKIFTARDRRALTTVLTAGLKHAQLDEIIAVHPIPGDPGHDAGKAGRVGLIAATILAGRDHEALAQALQWIEATRIPESHRADLARLRHKAGLAPTPEETPEAAPEDLPDRSSRQAPAAPRSPSPRHVPLVLLEELAEDHPVVQALLSAGIEVTHRAHVPDPDTDALVLRPASTL